MRRSWGPVLTHRSIQLSIISALLLLSAGSQARPHGRNKFKWRNCQDYLALQESPPEPREYLVEGPSSKKDIPPAEAQSKAELAPPVEIRERSVADIRNFKVGQYNIFGVRKNPYARRAKSEDQVAEMFRIMNEEDADIVFMEEVESRLALVYANNRYMGSKYNVFLHEGSDPIHVAVLVKKDLPFDFVVKSLMDKGQRMGSEQLFTRDFPVVYVYPKGHTDEHAAPLMVLMGHHFKSKRDRPGDPQSRRFAAAQFGAAHSLVADLLARYCQELPVMLAADFNRDLRTDAEPRALLDLMRDSFDLAKDTVPVDERTTQTFHPMGQGGRVDNQLDAILMSAAGQDLVTGARIPRYQNRDGTEKPLPNSFKERSYNPSDHYPVFIDVDFQRLIQRYETNKANCVEHRPAA